MHGCLARTHMQNDLNIGANRRARKYAPAVQMKRVLWSLIQPLFRFSPRNFFAWRCFLLRALGARIGEKVHIYNTATIYFPWNLRIGNWSAIGEHAFIYNLAPISIGDKTTISQRTHLCAGTHDHTKLDLPLVKGPIEILDMVWICADAFVGPNVKIGQGAVVGARAVVVKDVSPWAIVAGNPAKFIKKRIIGDGEIN